MSSSPEEAMAECLPESSASTVPAASGTTNNKQSAPIEKTISCVSCRRRKLKCDRTKPKCGTCNRLRHGCEYPERRRNQGAKRRNMKELEARLAQVETQLIAETKGNATSQASAVDSNDTDWNDFAVDMSMDMNMDMGAEDILDSSFNIPISAFDFQAVPPALPEGNFFSQELMSLGIQEPLPPDQMIHDLQQLYFDKFHPSVPMIHKYRYLSSLNLPSHMQPPICLRYAMWAQGASLSDEYKQYEDVLYERARKYVEIAEMKGHGESFVTVQYAQTWGLIATFEAKKTYFTRAWMSTGRMTRLVQMLGLQRIDGEGQDVKKILPPAKDWTEVEERRRTFWAAFYGDRWASSGTGWPMIINENEIHTNLPASEESFDNGIMGESVPLKAALTPEGASKITPFGGVVLSACLFGHNFEHLHKIGDDELPGDLANGEFWKRHRKMDNVLSNTFMFLPDHLRLPAGLRDMNVVFLHMNIHASTICLHQAAVLTAEKNNISKTFIRQSRSRSLMAAEEISNIMKLISHLDPSNMNSWVGFCLYVAGGVLVQDLRGEDRNSQSMGNLDFLLSAMNFISKRHTVTKHFTAQLELDIEGAGIKTSTRFSGQLAKPTVPLMGILAERAGDPMTVSDLHALSVMSSDNSGQALSDGICPYVTGMAKGIVGPPVAMEAPTYGLLPRGEPQSSNNAHRPFGLVPQWESGPQIAHGILPASSTSPTDRQFGDTTNDAINPSIPNWSPSLNTGSSNSAQSNRQQTQALEATFFPTSKSSSSPDPTPPGGSPFDINSFLAGNTPSSESSASNHIQFPYRQADSNSQSKSPPDFNTYYQTPNKFSLHVPTAPPTGAAEWMMKEPFNTETQNKASDMPNVETFVKRFAGRVPMDNWGATPEPHG